MNTYKGSITFCFNIICYIFAFYVTCDQFRTYLKNEDTSSFKIKEYRRENSNQYPDVSICFSVRETCNSYNQSKFPIANISWGKDELLYLMGRKNENNSYFSSDEGQKDIFKSPQDGKNGAPSIRPSWPMDEIGKSWFISSNYEYNVYRTIYKQHLEKNVEHSIAWLDYRTVCITRKLPHTPFDVIERQNIYLKIRNMQVFLFFWVVIHPRNQLIRTLGATSPSRMIGTATYRGNIPMITMTWKIWLISISLM